MNTINRLLAVALGIALVVWINVAAPRATKTTDVCIAQGTNTFVFQNVERLQPGETIPLHGLYIDQTGAIAPFHGTAAMRSNATTVLGLFVHGSAQLSNDITISGVTAADFSGSVNFDNDGDFRPNGTSVWQPADCSTIPIP